MKEELVIRAHHGMCLKNFIGKGYSSSFVKNMTSKKQYLELKNPIIKLITSCDSICENCPHNKKGKCTSMDKVMNYDKEVLKYCELEKNSILSWKEFDSLVDEKIRKTGIRKEICHDCQWNFICIKIESEG